MKNLLMVPALVGVLLVSLPAMADSEGPSPSYRPEPMIATMDPPTRCRLLSEQFAYAIRDRENMGMAEQAKQRYAEGLRLCANNEPMRGAARLEAALRDIGVVPRS